MITIKRKDSIEEIQVEIDERTVFSKKLMGEHKISTEFIVESPLGLKIGDYIVYNGEEYTLNRLPEITKINLKTYKYRADFEGPIYDLYNKLMMWEGLADFHYTGTAFDFLDRIITNINHEVSSGWTIDTVDNTEDRTIHFEGDSCRVALTRIAETFGLEFAIVGKQISLVKNIGQPKSYKFEYGRGNGLYQLDRKQVNSQNVVTRVYGFGSEKNIPYDYRDRAKRLIFEKDGNHYLEHNVDLYGVIEAQFTDDTIFPTRTGTVSAASVHFGNMDLTPPDWPEFYIEDAGLVTDDIDLNKDWIEGDVRKIVFKTGRLTGYELNIQRYDHSSGRIYYELFSEADGLTMPDEGVNQPQIGDTYTLVNIKMPQAYVDDAETRLQNATQKYLNQNSTPMVIYGLEFDPKYVKSNNVQLDIGDVVTIIDEQLGIDSEIRASEITYPLVNPNKIKATIADFVPYTIQEKSIKTAVEAKKETYFVERKSAELARRNTASLNRLKGHLLDQDGYFTMPIRPRSIETLYLAVGAKPNNLRLSGATFKENYGGNVDSFYASSCQLIHLEFKSESEEAGGSGDYTWIINDDYVKNDLVNDTYYLYAKCKKDDVNVASWHLSTDVISSDPGDEEYFYFGVGVLLPADDETPVRDFRTIYGKTYINGRNITTGIIESIDGNNYIDLDHNKFRIGDTESSIAWNHTNDDGTLRIKGAIVQSQDEVSEFPLGVFRGDYNPANTYFKGDQVTHNDETWLYIYNDQTQGNEPSDGSIYWKKIAAKGLQGARGADGSAGVDARAVNLVADTQGFKYDFKGENPSPSSAAINAKAMNTSGTVYYRFYKNDSLVQNSTSSTYNYTPETDFANMPDKIEVEIRDGSSSAIKARDQITMVGLKAGDNAITIVLTNEAHTLPTDKDGVVDYAGSGTEIKVWEGANPLTVDQSSAYGNGTFRVSASGSNITVGSASGSDGSSARVFSNHSNMTANTASITYTVTVKSFTGEETTFTKVQTFAKSLQGVDGAPGATGPSPVYRGVYEPDDSRTFYGNSTRIDVVRYPGENGAVYAAKTTAGEFSNVLPTDSTKWRSFGASIDVVATDLLLAHMAYVENLSVNHLRTDISTEPRIYINRIENEQTGASTNSIEIFEKDQPDTSTPVIKIDDTAGVIKDGDEIIETNPGIEIRKDGCATNINNKGIYIWGEGNSIYYNSESKCGLRVATSGSAPTGKYIAGIHSYAHNSSSGDSYAAYFEGNTKTYGLSVGAKRHSFTTTITLYDNDTFFNYTGTNNKLVKLMSNPPAGKIYYIRRQNSLTLTVNGNGKQICWGDGRIDDTYVLENKGMLYMFIFDGEQWSVGSMHRNQ